MAASMTLFNEQIDRRFAVTFFRDEFAKSLRTQEVSLHELREQIRGLPAGGAA